MIRQGNKGNKGNEQRSTRQISEEKAFVLMATLCAKREYCTLDIRKN